MNVFGYVKDSLVNLVSGMGGPQDKSTYNQYTFTRIDQAQLEAAYRGDWIARKAVDIPAQDATREWRAWQADKTQISLIEKEESRHKIKQKVREGLIKSRLLGGSALLIGVEGAGAWDEKLELDRVKKGSLKYVHVVDRYELTAGELDRDVESPYYGTPKDYSITSNTGMVTIHPSRIVRFVSKKLPTRQNDVDGWGDSIIDSINDAVKSAGSASQGIAALLEEASVDVIKIPDFMSQVSTADYRGRVIERFQLAKLGQSIFNSKILDKEEEWDKQQVNFSQLPEMLSLYLRIAAAAADIPATRMLGQAPSGLNATGDGDTRNYYDNVADEQKTNISSSMCTLDEVLIMSAVGSRPEEIHYNWRPLWQPTAGEQADIFLKRTQGVANIYNTGLVPDDAFSVAVQNMLIEDGSLPGLESALEEMPDDIEENDPEVESQFESA